MMSQCIPIPKITGFSKKPLKAYDVPVYPHS